MSSSTPSAPPSTILTSSSPRSSGTGRRRPAPLEGALEGHHFLNPVRDGAVLPSCTSTATRSRARRCSAGRATTGSGADRRPWLRGLLRRRRRPLAGAAGARRDPRRAAISGSGRSRRRAREAWRQRTAAVAGHRAANAQGLDRPRRSWTVSRSRAPFGPTRCRWQRLRDNPEHLAMLEAWMRSYGPEELFDERGRLVPSSRARAPGRSADGRESTRQRRSSARRSICRTSGLRARGRHAGARAARVHAPARPTAARRVHAERRQATSACSVPTRPTRIAWAMSSRSRTVFRRPILPIDDHVARTAG